MEWMQSIKKSISYMENHLLELDNTNDIAKEIGISSLYLQNGFKIMTGYSMSEYVRNRRLYLAALDVIADQEKIIDIAYKYGYETPESFTKAFTRFHGISPMQIRKTPSKVQIFLPLKINIIIQGGNEMSFVVEKMKSFKVIGFEHTFTFDTGYGEIPKFWDEFTMKYMNPLLSGKSPANNVEQTIINCNIGEYGICIDDLNQDGKFRYLIAGIYTEGEVPEGMTVFEFPESEWAKFSCVGPMPTSLQTLNTKIFKEWLPGNPDYDIAGGATIEWYSKGNPQSPDYESGIWLPVSHK